MTPPTTSYSVWVRTGQQNLAGTDSNVFLQLFGAAAHTEPIHLPAQDIFAFESGQTDRFVLDVPDLGALVRCCVGHDNSEGDSGWYVIDVRVQHEASGQAWQFVFDQWLGVDESGVLSACADASALSSPS